jgi:hypothetical protein
MNKPTKPNPIRLDAWQQIGGLVASRDALKPTRPARRKTKGNHK